MKFSDRVASFLKSLGGADDGEGKEEKGNDINLDDKPEGGGEPDGAGEGEGGESKKDDEGMEKSYTDATEIMTALVGELKGINKSLDTLLKRNEGIEKSQEDFGESIVRVAEMVAKIGNQPNTLKGTVSKSLPAGGAGAGATGGDVLTTAEFEQAQKALAKSFNAHEITLFDSSRLEREMQKAMTIVGYKMSPEDRAIIAKALKSA